MQLAPYLYFKGGTCAAALDLYKSVFGGSADIMRMGDTPMAASMPPETHDNVMHSTFTAPGITFMASDGRPGENSEGGNISMSIGSSDIEAGTKAFNALAEGGTITMPLEKQFWGATFGQVTDRYGIEWMFNLGM